MDYIKNSITLVINLVTSKIRYFKYKFFSSIYLKRSSLGSDVVIGDNCKLYRCSIQGEVKIGRFTSIYGKNTNILSKMSKIEIGNFCSIANNVLIIDYAHKINRPSSYYMSQNVFCGSVKEDLESKGNIIIGHDVWIGSSCTILSGVEIGNGSVIAANSLVNKSVPPYAVVAGNPARIIKYRFSEEKINKLQKMEWWHKSREEILEMKDFFLEEL